MTPRNSDASLVDALRAGRSDAFEHLYADYHAPIYNLCARIVGDREEAKDLTQEVFIRAFHDLPPAGAKLKLRAWLYRVATNACLNHLRSRRGIDRGDPAVLDEVPERVDVFAQAETVALVEASLAQISDRYRTALVLKDLQGLPPGEIADVMEISRPTADVLVHRARGAFKTAFAKLGGDGAAAPASLGLVLAPLGVPAALQLMPPLPAGAVPLHPPVHVPAAPHGVPLPDISSAAGPGGAGVLAKIGAALSTKVAVGAAAATLAVGGAVAVREVRNPAAGRWQGAPGPAWQSTPQKWSKQGARWSLYANWMRSGWPHDWQDGHWRWDGGSCSWTWHTHSGAEWSCDGAATSGGGDGDHWSATQTRSGSDGWASGSHDGGSHSSGGGSGHDSSSGSGGDSSHDSGSHSGSSGGSWDGGSTDHSWDGDGSSGDSHGSSDGSGW